MFLQIVCVCYCSPDDTDTRGSRCAHEQDQSFDMKFCVANCGRKRPKFGPPAKNLGSPKTLAVPAWTTTKVSAAKVFAVKCGLNACPDSQVSIRQILTRSCRTLTFI